MTTLVIVESPSKCKTIENYLGDGYKVVASYGHIRKLDSLDDVDMKTMEIKYVNMKGVNKLRKYIKESSKVIIATDDDREGESIGWHICKVFGLDLSTTQRIKFNDISKESILASIKEDNRINIDKVNSSRCRQLLDIYIGFTISPILWKYITHKTSAGRCQIPALRIIYDNYKELGDTKTSYEVYGYFTDRNIKFKLDKRLHDVKDFLKKCIDYDFKLRDIKIKDCKESSPRILTTSYYQQLLCGSMSPNTLMSLTQVLYENGLITYMRTDSMSYSETFKKTLESYINRKYGKEYCKKLDNIDSKVHEGIRVVDLNIMKTDFENDKLNKIYDFIYKHTLKTGMTDCETTRYEYIMDSPDGLSFRYNESETKFKGWRLINKDKDDELIYNYMKSINKFRYNYIECSEDIEDKIYNLSESQLINRLVDKGIGRPSTYAGIIDKIKDRKYVKKCNVKDNINVTDYTLDGDIIKENKLTRTKEQKNRLVITELGIMAIEFCIRYYDHIFNYEYTGIMEDNLDKIENECLDWRKLFEEFKMNIDMEVIIEDSKKSIICEDILIRKGKYGYYATYNKKRTSLLKWEFYSNIEEYILNNEVIEIESLKAYLNKKI